MEGGEAKSSPTRRRSAVRSGLVTGLSLALMSGTAAAVGAVLAQKFGRTAETDGFLAAYGVYLVLVLAAQSFRLVVVPDLTRAAVEGRLAAETWAYLGAFAMLAAAVSVAAGLLRHPIAGAITGSLPDEAADVAARSLVYLVPAAFAQLLAAIAASALAARDDYEIAAFSYAAGGVAGLVLFVLLANGHGTIALAWATVVNGAICAAVPVGALVRRGHLARAGGGDLRLSRRLWRLVEGSAVPVAIQGLYVVCLRAVSGLGVGSVTSFSYAYLIAAVFVAVTAASVALISSVPLTRRSVDVEAAAAHVVHASWLSLAVVAPAAGVFALVGGRVVGWVLGDAFSGDVGAELGRLVAYLAPWMVASVAFTVVFPLLFVAGRVRVLVPLALLAVVAHAGVAYGLREAFALEGVAVALALSTFLVVGLLLLSLSPRMLVLTALGLARLVLVVGAVVAASFVVLGLTVGGFPAAAGGLALYALALAVLRPRPLREAWAYLRALH